MNAPQVAAKSQLHSYGNDSLSLWPRVASKSQLDLHENLCVNVTALLKTCHPSAGTFVCVYSQSHMIRADPVSILGLYWG